MKKILFLTLIFVFLSGCAGEYYVEDTEKSVEIFKDILALKNELKSEPENREIRNNLAEQMFNLELERAKAADVRPGNEPFFINKNSNTSVLLIHGFTASPWELRELGERLAEKGYNVYGTLLAGHGTERSEMRKTTWRDWYENTKNAYEALNYISSKIFVVGISTGGSLGILLADDYKVDGLVCLACPIQIRDENTRLIPLLKYFYWYEKRELSEEEKLYYYGYRPLASIEQLTQLIDHYSVVLGDVNMPVLIVQNRNDPTVDPESAEFIFDKIKSVDKEIVYFDGDYHVLTKGEFKEPVFGLIYEFIEERE
ncbi:alpha/beta fold hydrolase [Candidatus Woesearchaeota archaeon]|nr:alpha/beta fold hydrolase [Candidatus Woesearchaeota archaeon]